MRYHNITKDDMLNGDGLRVVLWVAGCNHCCPECQNPVTWDPNGGLPFGEAERKEIFAELDKDYVSGITFSGGDPLHPANITEVTAFAKEIRKRYPGKTIWLYTGFLWEEICKEEIVRYLDVCVDGEFEVDKKELSLKWKGSSNQRVIDVPKTLQAGMRWFCSEDQKPFINKKAGSIGDMCVVFGRRLWKNDRKQHSGA